MELFKDLVKAGKALARATADASAEAAAAASPKATPNESGGSLFQQAGLSESGLSVQRTGLNSCQLRALEALQSDRNVFLTGVAGSGKSYLIERFLNAQETSVHFPVLASTGAAAILIGGRTFHSFFGLGIMEGGPDATIERALKNKRVIQRIKKADGVVIDEISMISGRDLRTAEALARRARESSAPWGGLRVITVGDFSQLPPVTRFAVEKDWAFRDPSWEKSDFSIALLKTIVRTQDEEFLTVLNEVRSGEVSERSARFLNRRLVRSDSSFAEFKGIRLFPRRDRAEKYNLDRLEGLEGKPLAYMTTYEGSEKHLADLKRNAPIPEVLVLKPGAHVMLRQNDPLGRWVNGSLGEVESLDADHLSVTLLDSERTVDVEPVTFSLLDADGTNVASATNFPISLAYASTIHKAQGTTLDQAMIDLRGAWEHGQAYVALSRVRTGEGLLLEGWNPRSIVVDPKVLSFQRSIMSR